MYFNYFYLHYYLPNLCCLCNFKLLQILRKAQDQLFSDVDASTSENVDSSVVVSSAAAALKDDRLTFVWLDGEVQKVDCLTIPTLIFN